VIWAEYAIDTARACRDRGLKTIAVTAGYISPEPRTAFFEVMDATNVDLKGFTEHFYQHFTLSHLQPVLNTLRWLKQESSVWLEITNLVVPHANDDANELRQMCGWIRDNLGADVPLHFTAFHPDYRMMDTPPTPAQTLCDAREIAIESGLHYVYVGNLADSPHQSTYCPNCREQVIQRKIYDVGAFNLNGNQCRFCGQTIAGHFGERPGHWGTRRLPIDPAALLRSLESERPKTAKS
jgi:pyruvate formate lyase activating enzyme